MAESFEKPKFPSRKKPLTKLVQGTLHVFDSPNCNGAPLASFDAEITVAKSSGPLLPAVGHLFSHGRHVGTMQGAFPPEILGSTKSPGAPKKTARDLALYCAFTLSRARRWENGDKSIIRAREDVLGMWQRQGFQGLHNERNVASRLRQHHVKDANLKTGVEFIYITAQGPAWVLLVDRLAEWAVYDDYALVNGDGWIWTEGQEQAHYSLASLVMKVEWSKSQGTIEWVGQFRHRVASDSTETIIIYQDTDL